jgi:hypothetical protein
VLSVANSNLFRFPALGPKARNVSSPDPGAEAEILIDGQAAYGEIAAFKITAQIS